MTAQDDNDSGSESVPNLALLKWIVIVLGVLIVAGVLFLIVTVVNRVDDVGTAADSAAAALPPGGFDSAAITAAPGARIVSASAGGGIVLLTVRAPDAPDMVVLVDAATGQERGRLVLETPAQ